MKDSMKERLREIQKNLRRLSSSVLTVGKRRASQEVAETSLTEADVLRDKRNALINTMGNFIHYKNMLEEYLKEKPVESITQMDVNVVDKAREAREVLLGESSGIEEHAELFKGWNAEERAIIYDEVFENFIEEVRELEDKITRAENPEDDSREELSDVDTESAEADKSARKEKLKEMGMRSRQLSREEVMPEVKPQTLSAEQELEKEFKEFQKYLAEKNSAMAEDLEKLTKEVGELLARKSSAPDDKSISPASSSAMPKKDGGSHTPDEGNSPRKG